MSRGELNQTFAKLVRQAGMEGRGARARPRPYDLRHAFAVRTLLDWHRAGADIDRRMPPGHSPGAGGIFSALSTRRIVEALTRWHLSCR